MTLTEALQFINSTNKSAGLQSKVNDWKEKHCNLSIEDDGGKVLIWFFEGTPFPCNEDINPL